MVQDDLGIRCGSEYVPDAQTVLALFKDQTNTPVSLWGAAPIAPIHFGYDELILNQISLIKMGCCHIVLLADFHAMMTHNLSFADATARALYYEHYLRNCCGLKAQYVRGSEFQMRIDYIEKLFSLCSVTRTSWLKNTIPAQAKKNTPDGIMVSTFLYSLMQCLDAYYLGANLVIAEHGQKKIYDVQNNLMPLFFNSENIASNLASLRRIRDCNFTPCFAYIPTSHDIRGKPLIESKASTRISIHETKASLEQKVFKMFAPPAKQEIPSGMANALLEHFRYSVFPWIDHPVEIKGEDRSLHKFQDYGELSKAYEIGLLHPTECKQVLLNLLWIRICRIQDSWSNSLTKWIDVNKAIGI